MNRQISNFSEIRKNSELKNRSIKITQTETQRKKNEIYIRAIIYIYVIHS